MPPELILLGVVLGLALGAGVPAVRRTNFVPRELHFETVPDAELDQRQSAHFTRLDLGLAQLGFRPQLTFRVPNLQGSNLTRAYVSDVDPAVIGASALHSRAGKVEQSEDYVEIITKYEDGTTLTTRNGNVSSIFDPMPQQVQHVYPALRDLAKLKQRHDRHAEPLRVRGPRFPHGRDLLAEYAAHHRRFCEFQRQRGLLAHDTQADLFRPRTRLALRGVARFFNPFQDNFTLPRLVAGLLLGAALPAAGVLTADAAAAWLSPAVGLPAHVCRLGVWALVFGLAGAAVGYLFTSKCFVWALALGYVPLRLLAALGRDTALMLLWMGYVADRVAAWRSRRRQLV